MAIWPFIILRNAALKNDRMVLNHEKIHIRQQLECLVLPFYVIYLSEYMYHRLRGLKHAEAYLSISFEKEAYKNEKNRMYLKERKVWANFRKS
ncbi:MAG: hypothetical protein H6605_02585 [Flavobacteriales bacterium]|nr:hypothetical protein [Flavobacteriales bacterium]